MWTEICQNKYPNFTYVRVIKERSYRIPVDITMIWWSLGTTSSLISTDWTPILGNIFFKKSTRFSSSKAKSTVISHFLAVFFRYKWSPRIWWRFGTTQSQVSLTIYWNNCKFRVKHFNFSWTKHLFGRFFPHLLRWKILSKILEMKETELKCLPVCLWKLSHEENWWDLEEFSRNPY